MWSRLGERMVRAAPSRSRVTFGADRIGDSQSAPRASASRTQKVQGGRAATYGVRLADARGTDGASRPGQPGVRHAWWSGERRDPRQVLTQHQGVNLVRALVGDDRFEVHQMPNDRVLQAD